MRSVKNQIVYVLYEGNFSQRSSSLLFQEILDLKPIILERNLLGICIKMKNVQLTLPQCKEFVQKLVEIQNKIFAPIAVIEYRSKMFPYWREATKNSSIKLFKTEQIAQLFLNPKSLKQKLKVLLFDDADEIEVEKQASFLAKFEHNIVYTSDKTDFETKLSNQNVDFAISQTKLNQQASQNKPDSSVKSTSSGVLKLSKNVILNLPLFIDTAVDNLVTLTGLNAQKTSHNIAPFQEEIEPNIISAIMTFHGGIEGSFVLIFPKDLALEAIEAMLGEALERDDIAGIKDGVGEFCNIITGNAKTKFQSKDINVTFELPKTFTSIEDTKNFLSDANGIWINMKLENNPFYMFLTN
jgi:CheY-specific phosphatase CheX